jgi:hypothetical protein
MDFIQYLMERHLLVDNANKIHEVSAKQYNSRLRNMIKKRIYNEEEHIDFKISDKINDAYTNIAGEYDRTLKYYLEFKNYVRTNKKVT